MSFNSQNSRSPGSSQDSQRSQAAPIPINMAGAQRGGGGFQLPGGSQFSADAGAAGSMMDDAPGIRAPQNSLAVPSSLAGPAAPGSIGISIGGANSNRLPIGADLSGSYKYSQGIHAPPPSLATPSSLSTHMMPSNASIAAQLVGGFNAPPNTPAQTSRLHQMMGKGAAATGEYGAGQVPTGSFIDRRINAFERLGEADEDEMDMDDASPDSVSPASYHHAGSRHANKDPEDMFEMEQ
ncbi:hypothetical protein GGI07_000329 [Coemansia sp. Benny D115]|nr:hypothetical protein GGI07_000329 [Coemansia sp. Benny D115]